MDELQVNMVLEIMGRPKEHLIEALNNLVAKLEGEKNVKVLEKITHEPTHIKDTTDLYTTFTEVTLEISSLDQYFFLLFAYMPSHVELVYPEKIKITNEQLNQFANQLIQRLHNYDAIVKKVLVDRDELVKIIKANAPPTITFNQPTTPSKDSKTESKKSSKTSKKKRL